MKIGFCLIISCTKSVNTFNESYAAIHRYGKGWQVDSSLVIVFHNPK